MFDPYVEHVWSLCDGQTSVDQILADSRLGNERTLSILMNLRRLGAIVLASDSPETAAARAADCRRTRTEASGVHVLPAPRSTRIARGSSGPPVVEEAAPPIVEEAAPVGSPLAAGSVSTQTLSPEEVEGVAEPNDLSSDEKHRVIAMRRVVGRGDPHEILGVAPGIDAVGLQLAFRSRCKEFHPDRFYGRDLGSFAGWISEIFSGIQTAYARLSSVQAQFQSKREHAAEMFENACRLEANDKYDEALRMFGAACRVDSRPAYLRRAARCALAAGDTDRAEYYALGAVDLASTDPSTLRVLADVYREQDRLVRAEVVLRRAVELCTGSEQLALELRRDLDRVQGWLRSHR